MLHVLPSGTYGLRPAVNRSNTRTRSARHCVYTGGRVRCCGAGRIAFHPAPRPPQPHPPLSSRFSLHLSSQELHHQVITSTSSCVPAMVLPASHHRRRIRRPRSFPKPLRPVTAHHRETEFSRKSREIDVSAL